MVNEHTEITGSIIELTAPRTIEFKAESLNPSRLDPDQIIGRTIFSAISPGTELAAYAGAPPLRPMKVYPRLMGYCNVAEVIAKGPNVTELNTGDKILTTQSHRTIFACRQNEVLVKVPESMNLEHASTTYLFHLGYNALLRGGFVPGMNVGVVGLGTLGLTTAVMAHTLGANIFTFSNQAPLQEFARKFASARSFSKDAPGLVDAVKADTRGIGLDLVVSTSNSWADWQLALSLPRYGGVISVLGFPGRVEPVPSTYNPLESRYFYDRQLTLAAAGLTPDVDVDPSVYRFSLKRNCQFLLGLIDDKRLTAEPFISIRAPWKKIESVYKDLESREAGILTAVLDWRK